MQMGSLLLYRCSVSILVHLRSCVHVILYNYLMHSCMSTCRITPMSVFMLSGSRPSLLAQSNLRFVGVHLHIHIEGVQWNPSILDTLGTA